MIGPSIVLPSSFTLLVSLRASHGRATTPGSWILSNNDFTRATFTGVGLFIDVLGVIRVFVGGQNLFVSQVPINRDYQTVALVVGGGRMQLYINGSSNAGFDVLVPAFENSNKPLHLGSTPTASVESNSFDGLISDVLFFSGQLPPSKIGEMSSIICLLSGACSSSGGTITPRTPTISVREDVGSVVVQLDRAGGSDGTVSVSFAANPSSLSGPSDFVPVSGSLTWYHGDTSSKAVQIPLIRTVEYYAFSKPFYLNLTILYSTFSARAESAVIVLLGPFNSDLIFDFFSLSSSMVSCSSFRGSFCRRRDDIDSRRGFCSFSELRMRLDLWIANCQIHGDCSHRIFSCVHISASLSRSRTGEFFDKREWHATSEQDWVVLTIRSTRFLQVCSL